MELIEIPFHDTSLSAAAIDGKPHVALRAACASLGIDYSNQLKKLRAKSWAVVVMSTTTGADGKTYEMTMIDRRTLTMWLATIDPNRVAEHVRPVLETFQDEAADALDAYFHEGGAINPRATDEQLEDLHGQIISLADRRLEMLSRARGFVAADWLEQKFRLVIARGLGEAPEIDLDDRQLIVDDFLAGKGMNKLAVKAARSVFGKRVAAEYEATNGHAPSKAPGEIGGRVRQVNFYSERDRPIFEAVWERDYAEDFGQLILQGVTA